MSRAKKDTFPGQSFDLMEELKKIMHVLKTFTEPIIDVPIKCLSVKLVKRLNEEASLYN